MLHLIRCPLSEPSQLSPSPSHFPFSRHLPNTGPSRVERIKATAKTRQALLHPDQLVGNGEPEMRRLWFLLRFSPLRNRQPSQVSPVALVIKFAPRSGLVESGYDHSGASGMHTYPSAGYTHMSDGTFPQIHWNFFFFTTLSLGRDVHKKNLQTETYSKVDLRLSVALCGTDEFC